MNFKMKQDIVPLWRGISKTPGIVLKGNENQKSRGYFGSDETR
jgi:hypothetical protein